jgi:hypothetical protein
MKLRATTDPGKHPCITVHRKVDRNRDLGPPLATVHCHENAPRVDYSATDIDSNTFNELTRFIRDAMGQLRTLVCGVCGRIPTR